ncbi:MAG: cache domain-containing protein [Clostridiales bacterium]|nr:cache domain-containing protein [Clostridiales bacterium]
MLNSLKTRMILSIAGLVSISILITFLIVLQNVTSQMKLTLDEEAISSIEFTKRYIEVQYNNILRTDEIILETKKKQLTDTTDLVFVQLEEIYKAYETGTYSESQAKKLAIETISRAQYGDGFFWIHSMEKPYPRMILNTQEPSLNGKVLDDSRFNALKATNENVFKHSRDMVQENSEGYFEYYWYEKKGDQKDKMAYVRLFEPWQWVIGTDLVYDEIEEQGLEAYDTATIELNKINNESRTIKGYFFVFDSNHNMLVHPNLAGQNTLSLINPLTGNPITRELMGVSDFNNEYLEYLWDKPDDPDNFVYTKRAYVTYFEPLDWYIASSYYEDEINKRIYDMIRIIISVFIILLIVSIVLAILISSSITNPLSLLVEKILKTDKEGIPNHIEISGTTEVQVLSETMNHMISSIRESQAEIKSSHNKLQNILDSATKLSVVSTDPNGLIQIFNIGSENMLGYKAEELIDIKTPEIFHLQSELIERSRVLSELYQKNISGFDVFRTIPDEMGYEESEWTYVRKDGTHLTANLIVTKIVDEKNNITGYLGMATDITSKKDMEKKLKERTEELKRAVKNLITHEEHLEDMVNERTIKLEESVKTIQETQNQLIESEKMALLGSLVAGVAHEINTPVGISITLASNLEDRSDKFIKKLEEGKLTRNEVIDFVQVVSESSKMLYRTMKQSADLVQSFKLVAVDQSVESKRQFELCEYIQEILNSLGSKFERANIKIKVTCENVIFIDSYPGTFYQILTNLLMNSLKHGFMDQESGVIEIELIDKEESFEIIYQDNGVGIDEDQTKKIFEPFYTTRRSDGGTGLGLNIVNNLIYQKLKGNLTFTSSIDEGIKFVITIPK